MFKSEDKWKGEVNVKGGLKLKREGEGEIGT